MRRSSGRTSRTNTRVSSQLGISRNFGGGRLSSVDFYGRSTTAAVQEPGNAGRFGHKQRPRPLGNLCPDNLRQSKKENVTVILKQLHKCMGTFWFVFHIDLPKSIMRDNAAVSRIKRRPCLRFARCHKDALLEWNGTNIHRRIELHKKGYQNLVKWAGPSGNSRAQQGIEIFPGRFDQCLHRYEQSSWNKLFLTIRLRLIYLFGSLYSTKLGFTSERNRPSYRMSTLPLHLSLPCNSSRPYTYRPLLCLRH